MDVADTANLEIQHQYLVQELYHVVLMAELLME
jgi:hypothetical protein